MKLLVPVDATPDEAWCVVDQATRFAGELTKAHVRLLMVHDPTDRAAHDLMSELAEGVLKCGAECTYHLVAGNPGDRIVEEAHEADIVVMGTHGRRGLQRALVGSVAEHVIRHAPVPVMVVRLVA